MADFRLYTERLVLRNWAPGDIDRFAAVANTPQVMRHPGEPADPATLVATDEWRASHA